MADQRRSTVTSVREGGPGVADLAALLDRYRTHYGRPSDVPRSRAWVESGLASGALHAFVAYDGPIAQGMALAAPTPASLRLAHFWQLRDLYVDAQHRGRGIGRDLVREVCLAARADGAIRVALTTEEVNAPARGLYAALGFAPVSGYVHLALDLGADRGRA